jgi:replicative DNA helicase
MSISDSPPPCNLDAERAVIGGVLFLAGLLPEAVRDLETEVFYSTGHRAMWGGVRRLAARSEPIDIVTLREELQRAGELEEAGGAEALYALAEGTPTAAHLEHYARIVVDLAAKRELRSEGLALVEASGNGWPAADLLRDHEDRVARIRERLTREAEQLRRGAAVVGPSIAGYMPPALPTGIPDLDRSLGGGLRPGFTPITGRWGRGKTTWANQIVANAAACQVPCLVISLEDSIERQVAVMVARLAQVDSKEIGTGVFTDEPGRPAEEKARLVEEAYAFYSKELDPWVSFTAEPQLARLERLVTAWARQHEQARHRVVLLDTAHSVSVDAESAVERMDRVAAAFKRLQLDHRLIVLATCHQSRAGEIRDSTEIEFKADMIVKVEAEDPDHPAAEDRSLDDYCRQHTTVCVRLVVAKDKVAGQTGQTALVFRKPLGEFTGRAR